MELIIGKTAGFCFGVRNAVEKTYEMINEKKKLYCFGELVHNELIIDKLNENGVKTIDDINIIPNDSNVIIRAHGIPPEIYNIAKLKNLKLIDLTCPKVAKIHELAENFSKSLYYIMLIAENNHAETIGTKGFCGSKSSVIENVEDVEIAIDKFKKSGLEKIAIIAQTTFGMEKFEEIVNCIKGKTNCEIEIKNTICNATAMRQKETDELSKIVDLMIIVGGKKSANTKRLYEISIKNCKNVILIQNKDDEDLKKIVKNKFERIGLMAGASTPIESINEVAEYINKN